jgi:Cu+-exporting ATPase
MLDNSNSKRLEKANIHITGMTCTTCAATIKKGLAEIPGVKQANINFAAEKAAIEYDSAKVDLAKIKNTISQLGYGVALKKSIFPVEGMTCASCVARVEQALSSVPGVVSTSVNLASEKATVEYTEGTELTKLYRAVADAGYKLGSEAQTLEDVTTAAERELRGMRNRFIVAAILTATIMAIMWAPEFVGKPYLLWLLATPVQFWAGWRF